MQKIILGSSSPRRKEILSFFKLPFTQVAPKFDEENAPVLSHPHEYALSLAQGKALSLVNNFKNIPILGADTVVQKEGIYYAKPQNRAEAVKFLQTFSGQWQTVVTGLALVKNEYMWTDYEKTQVKFNILSDAMINAYLDHNTWDDKAGGYSIIGPSSLLIEKIEGCFYNAVGLPCNALYRLLLNASINLWHI